MRTVDVHDNGTTTIELTDREAHQLRDELSKLSSNAAHTLQRLLAMVHGERAN